MSLSYYRGITFIKDYFVKYLQYIFYANSKDQLAFFDGTKKISFSATPHVVKQYSWDFRDLPVVEVGPADGKFVIRSISKDFLGESQYGDATSYKEVGGDIELTIAFKVIATTIVERDNLMDIIGIYLSHPIAKDFFQQHMITIEDAPSISEGGMEPIPDIDHKIFYSTLSMPILGTWRDNSEQDVFLEEIIAYVNLYEDS